MQVFQHQHQGLGLARFFKESGDGREQPEPGLLRAQRRRRPQAMYLEEQVREDTGDIGSARAHLSTEPFGPRLFHVGPELL